MADGEDWVFAMHVAVEDTGRVCFLNVLNKGLAHTEVQDFV